jgi:hypothetical protein
MHAFLISACYIEKFCLFIYFESSLRIFRIIVFLERFKLLTVLILLK